MTMILSQLLGLFQSLVVQPLVYLCPFKWAVVHPGFGAVRYTFGNPSKTLPQGFHVATMFETLRVHHIRGVPIATESVHTLTSDGVPLRVNAAIVYQIHDLPMFLACAEDPDTLIAEKTEAMVCEVIGSVPYENLTNIDAINDTLREDLESELKNAGVSMTSARVQNIEHLDPVARAILASGCEFTLTPTVQPTIQLETDPSED